MRALIFYAERENRTLMGCEPRGILSPVRLPVPPLQQVYDSFEFTAGLRHAYCNGSPRHHLTLRSRAASSRVALSCILLEAFSGRGIAQA